METCKHGHPRTPDNVRYNSSGHRICRECANRFERVRRNRTKDLRFNPRSPEGREYRNKVIREMVSNKYTSKQIADHLGITVSAFRDWCHTYNIEWYGQTFDSIIAHRRSQIEQWNKEGLHGKEMAERLGISPTRFFQWCREHKAEVNSYHSATVQRRADLLEQYAEEGLSHTEIADRLGIRWDSLRNWCLRNGVKVPKVKTSRNPPKTSPSGEPREKIFIRMRAAGHNSREIADHLGITMQALHSWWNYHGFIWPKEYRKVDHDKRHARVQEMMSDRMTKAAIAKDLGIAVGSLYRWAENHMPEFLDYNSAAGAVEDINRNRIKILQQTASPETTWQTAAQETGMSVAGLRKWCNKYGVTLRGHVWATGEKDRPPEGKPTIVRQGREFVITCPPCGNGGKPRVIRRTKRNSAEYLWRVHRSHGERPTGQN